MPTLQPQVAVTLTTANDDRSSTIERTAYGCATVVLASLKSRVEVTMNAEGELDVKISRAASAESRKRELMSAFMDPDASSDHSLRVRWHRAFVSDLRQSEGGYEYVRLLPLAILPPR
jgi:hypothetical protein